MAKTLPTGWQQQIQKIHQSAPWVWAWNFQLQKNAVVNTRAYLVAYHSPMTLFGLTFYPYPMKMSAITESGEGDLPQMQVQLSNTTRSLAHYFETVPEDEGIVGSIARAWLVNVSDETRVSTFEFEVAGATLTDEAITLRMEMPNFFKRRVPQDRFNQQRCRHRFGTGTAERPSPCQYIVNASSGFTDCGKTFDECVARGDDEASRGLTRLHPMRFGGFLGIPRQ